MITRIRAVRSAKGLTLQEVAERCIPPTTAQTIGRLETGTRTVSVAWLNRIAAALGVGAGDLVSVADRPDLPIAAILQSDGVHAPGRDMVALVPEAGEDLVAISVAVASGEYRSGDEIWCRRLPPDEFGVALNRDLLVPRPGGRFLFGRLIGHDGGMLHLLPLGSGQRQMVVADPPWAAVASKLIRTL